MESFHEQSLAEMQDGVNQATCISGQEDGLYFHFNFVIPGSHRYDGPEICSAPIDAKTSLRILFR